ncbi:MAG: amidohydrolase family protein [Candidatus Lokiarchaeota archaeon]|nr:amidohydrolase family protein [Candidatus Lokiarchaeota archaeon]MBD3199115.1 amidohydrolase family protein [Candidatus Lokiarchaeota archaeon]
MILKNCKIFYKGILRQGNILINNGIIQTLEFGSTNDNLDNLVGLNSDKKILDVQNRVVLPGIIDIHAHLRDLNQKDKETFLTGTHAAAFSGITTVFNMPNTQPAAITAKSVENWMKEAEGKIYVNVAFISGVPRNIDEIELQKILDLAVIGFKIYPHEPLSGINWNKKENFTQLLEYSSKYNFKIFIHPHMKLQDNQNLKKQADTNSLLKKHNKLNPCSLEIQFVEYALNLYTEFINNKNGNLITYPQVHFCHISCKGSYKLIQSTLNSYSKAKITYEITPHHLLLSNDLELDNPLFGKVMPPLRNKEDMKFLYSKIQQEQVMLIGTDHAPHTLEEKMRSYLEAPSGFPGFETYPLVILNEVCNYKLALSNFVKIASENPCEIFNLKKRGYIREGYHADLIIVEKVNAYPINPNSFRSKAKFSPFKNHSTCIKIWKVLLSGIEVNNETVVPHGKIIKTT